MSDTEADDVVIEDALSKLSGTIRYPVKFFMYLQCAYKLQQKIKFVELLNLLTFVIMIIAEVEVLGLAISELGTFVSDLIMGLACLLFYSNLKSGAENQQQRFLSLFFLFFAVSSIVAAFAHGLYLHLGKTLHVLSWSFGALAVYSILMGSVSLIKNQSVKQFYKWFNFGQLILLIVLLMIVPEFYLVKISYAFSLIGILLPLYIIDSIRNKFKANRYIYLGIAIACFPALFHTVQLEFGYIFNMNDLSHFMLVICFYFVNVGLQRRFFQIEPEPATDEEEYVEI
jgi:hypothetical protein